MIEAYEVLALGITGILPPPWLVDAIAHRVVEMVPTGGAVVHTWEGHILAGVGDWIIQGVKGELYPCKPDIFAATYEAVEP